jgi:hypothetical protein
MADGRKNNGGHSTKGYAGRPKKVDEIAMIERMDAVLAPEEAWIALANKVNEGDTGAIKTWLEYRYGKPKQSVDVTSGGESLPILAVQVVKPNES